MQNMKRGGGNLSVACLLAAVMGLTGCTTYQQQGEKVTQLWRHGKAEEASIEYTNKAEKESKTKDAVIWRLEQGTAMRAAGHVNESTAAFEKAEQKIDEYEKAAKVSVSSEAAATMSNLANLPYKGRSYDKIMLNTYKALNYLQAGEPEKARVELIRAYQRQQDAVEENKKRLEEAQSEATQSKETEKVEKAKENERYKEQYATAYAGLDQIKAYSDYVNPFTVYLDGLFFAYNSTGGSDLERAHKSLERVSVFATENPYVKQDLETVEKLMADQPLVPTTYVIFETGQAPIREQVRIDIPIIVAKVSYVGTAFPTLKILADNYYPALTVQVQDKSLTTAMIASMDSVVGTDFKNELPVIMTKTMVSTISKTVASYAVNQAASQQSEIAGLFAKLATAAYQASVNIADLRTWTTLPKEFQVCRLVTPADRKIEIATLDASQKQTVDVAEGVINVVYVRSISDRAPLQVSQMKLK
jgi:hypothetical protein